MGLVTTPSGLNVSYDCWGDGPDMVLIHGNPCDNRLWIYQTAYFSSYYRIVAPDLRGYGRSSKPSDPFTIRDLSEDLYCILQELSAKDAIVAGISVGGMVARQFASDHREGVRALILVGDGLLAPRGQREFAHKRHQGYLEKGMNYREEHILDLMSQNFRASGVARAMLSMYRERIQLMNPVSIIRMFEAIQRWDQPDTVVLEDIPMLIVSGDMDSAHASALDLHRRVPGSEHKTIHGAAHLSIIERPDVFNEAMKEFLQERSMLPT